MRSIHNNILSVSVWHMYIYISLSFSFSFTLIFRWRYSKNSTLVIPFESRTPLVGFLSLFKCGAHQEQALQSLNTRIEFTLAEIAWTLRCCRSVVLFVCWLVGSFVWFEVKVVSESGTKEIWCSFGKKALIPPEYSILWIITWKTKHAYIKSTPSLCQEYLTCCCIFFFFVLKRSCRHNVCAIIYFF